MGHRIGSHLPAAARQVFAAGWRLPARLRASTWQERVDALGRGHDERHDESTARYLDLSAALVRWSLDRGRALREVGAWSRQVVGVGPDERAAILSPARSSRGHDRIPSARPTVSTVEDPRRR